MDFLRPWPVDCTPQREEVAAAHDGWIEGEMEGAASLLVDLKAAGHTTACLSNTCACHWDEMQRWPIFRHIDFPHASHLLGAFKPDGKIYEGFCPGGSERAGDILFFDDRRPNIEVCGCVGVAGHARAGGDASHPAHSSDARLIGVALTITRGDLRGRAQNFGGHHGGKHAPRESEPKFDVAAVFIQIHPPLQDLKDEIARDGVRLEAPKCFRASWVRGDIWQAPEPSISPCTPLANFAPWPQKSAGRPPSSTANGVFLSGSTVRSPGSSTCSNPSWHRSSSIWLNRKDEKALVRKFKVVRPPARTAFSGSRCLSHFRAANISKRWDGGQPDRKTSSS